MDAKEFEALLGDVEGRLDRLRSLYEQYFQGIERAEPVVPRKEVDRRIALLMRNQPRNTALRFRYQMIVQKYTTYQVYWRRIVRQIEEGTYHPHVMRARARVMADRAQRADSEAAPRPKDNAWEIDIEVAELDANSLFGAADVESALSALGSVPPRPSVRPVISPFAPRPSRVPAAGPVGPASPSLPTPIVANKPASPPPPSAPREVAAKPAIPPPAPRRPQVPLEAAPPRSPPPPPAAARGSGGDGIDIKKVYESYVEARRRNNERTDNVRLETLEKSIHNMLPKLREKHRGKNIDFEVVVKDGKVGLKPVAK